jgi:CHAT domain-containing protein
MARENFVLQARTLPEKQALDYSRHRANGLFAALSVLAKHPEMRNEAVYQEVIRSRALVTEEMARRQHNLNAQNDPEVAKELQELDKARADLLKAENAGAGASDAVAEATARMEKAERALAERSAAVRADERTTAVRLEDVRANLPAHTALVSYAVYQRSAVEAVDPERHLTLNYIAFVLRAGSPRIRVFDLGEVKPVDELVGKLRASADAEAHSGGVGSTRNERQYRETGLELKRRIWDPLAGAIEGAKLVMIVPDGVLNLAPFAALPEGDGYLVEKGPVVHVLTSERDLLPEEAGERKQGLLAVGGPAFDVAVNHDAAPAPTVALRGAPISCDDFKKIEFAPLPGSMREVTEISSEWKRWRGSETAELLTGDQATREKFLEESSRNRVLHVATHAFVLDKSCGNGNPLLHSGLVFAGANQSRQEAMLTAQQIASLDLGGVDWAVLSACNTGSGELRDGEGVLGLERAFRVAGARSVVMTLWPVDDEVTRRYMRALYRKRFEEHAMTAEAAWGAARTLLKERRAAGESTHPWYWAGFVAAGDWK